MKLKDENYTVIQGWMINNLNLRGSELLAFAIIYGFCQGEECSYTGGISYLAEWLQCSRPGVVRVLNSLLEKKLIIKNKIKIRDTEYGEYLISSGLTGVNRCSFSDKNVLTGVNGGVNCSEPINNNINKDINNIIKENTLTSIKEKFSKPSLEDIKAYCSERNNYVDPERFHDYYESNGWRVGKNPMKDWKAAVRTWERTTPKPKVEEVKDYGWDE